MRRLRPLLVALIAALALLSLRETNLATACSGRGGRYDTATRRCDVPSFQVGFEPAPPLRRNQVLQGVVIVAAVGAATAVLMRRRVVRARGG